MLPVPLHPMPYEVDAYSLLVRSERLIAGRPEISFISTRGSSGDKKIATDLGVVLNVLLGHNH